MWSHSCALRQKRDSIETILVVSHVTGLLSVSIQKRKNHYSFVGSCLVATVFSSRTVYTESTDSTTTRGTSHKRWPFPLWRDGLARIRAAVDIPRMSGPFGAVQFITIWLMGGVWLLICSFCVKPYVTRIQWALDKNPQNCKILSLLDRHWQQVSKMVITRTVSMKSLFRHNAREGNLKVCTD